MRSRMPIAALAAAALVVALPSIATAHVHLESSSPTAGENLDSPPSEVTLTFDGELETDGSSFAVTDADGHEVGSGTVDLTVADRNVLIGEVTITEPGIYTVSYTVLGADGHEIEGSFSFGYDSDESVPQPADDEDDHQPDTALPSTGHTSGLSALGLLLLLAAALSSVGRRVLR